MRSTAKIYSPRRCGEGMTGLRLYSAAWPTAHVLDGMVNNKIPLTQRNYIERAYMGDKHTIDDLYSEGAGDRAEEFPD